MMLERHAQFIKIPEYGPQSFEEGNAKDHIKAIEWNGITFNCKKFRPNASGNITSKSTTCYSVTIGNNNTSPPPG